MPWFTLLKSAIVRSNLRHRASSKGLRSVGKRADVRPYRLAALRWHVGSRTAVEPGRMRIGSDDSFLSLERVGQEGPTVVWRIAAAVTGVGCIVAVHGRAEVRTTDETPERVANFKANRVQQFELMLSQGGWLRIKRDRRGRTLVRYRLGQLSAGAALEGKVRLEGECAKAFCRDLGGLL